MRTFCAPPLTGGPAAGRSPGSWKPKGDVHRGTLGVVVRFESLRRRRAVQDLFGRSVPIKHFALALSTSGHDHRNRMRKAMLDRSVRLLAATQTIEPVPHMGRVAVGDEREGTIGLLH